MLGSIALISATSLVLVWLGYPLCVGAVARMRRRRSRDLAPSALGPTVSVVLATREAAPAVQARVEDLLRTSYPGDLLEVIVALDVTAEGVRPADLAMQDARVRVVAGDAPGGKAAALNAGVRAATGEVLVFTDTHQRFDTDAVPRLVAALADARVGAASGRLLLPAEGRKRSLVDRYWALERRLRRDEARIHSAVGVSGSIYALRRSLWEPLPAGLILDDLYVPMRVVLRGHRVDFVDDAFAFETRRPAIAHEYRRKVRTLTGNLQLCAWLPGVLVPVRNPIWLQFVCHKLLRLLTPYWLLAIVAWIVAAAWRAMGEHAPVAALVAIVLLLLSFFIEVRPARSVRSLLFQGAVLQAAVVTATFNGLRGRWDVWHR